MRQQIDLKPAEVRRLGGLSYGAAELVRPGRTAVAGGWTPGRDPEFKSTLLVCRRRWTDAFSDLDEVLTGIGDKLHATANTVDSGDTASADQF